MFRSAFVVSSLLLSAVLSVAQPARAEPLPYDNTVQLGRPLHPVRLTLTTGRELTLVSAGKRRVLPAESASEVTVEVVPIADDAAVAVVRVRAANGRWVGLLGGRSGSELLLFESADPTGDPGEQRTRELVVGGTPSSLRTGLQFEGVSLCADRPGWLDAKRLDPSSLTLVTEGLPNLPDKLEQAAVAAAPTPFVHPALSLLSAVASSQLDEATLSPRVPRALVDDDPARGYAPPAGGFSLLRWQGGALPIERLELNFSATSARPIQLLWYGDQEAVVQATVQTARGLNRVSIVPPRPLAGRCLALRIMDAQGIELRELYAYTDLDRPEGVERLIASLVQDSPAGAAAGDLLEQLGPPAAERLAARWPELPARGRRRGLKVLARALENAGVRQRVLETAQAADPELRERAIAVLERGGDPGRLGLRQLVLVPDDAGDLAARALSAHPEELPALLTALASERGAERPVLRKALSIGAHKDPGHAHAAALVWLTSAPSVSAQAALALSFAGAGDRDFAAQLADANAANAQTFEDRYRTALALAAASPSAAGDAWLAQQAEHAEEWMQRSAALSALVQRGATSVPAIAEQLAHDSYPRVRALSLAPVFATGKPGSVEQALAHDPWPLVRAQAARVLAPRLESRAALELAVADRSRLVRRAAIESLASARRVESWPQVRARLAQADESLDVRQAAIDFARGLCVADARDALHGVAKRVLSPDASDDDTQLAIEALRALHDLGGQAATDAAKLVAEDGGPELTKLWQRLPPAHCAHVPQA